MSNFALYRGGPCFPGCLPAFGPQMPAVCPQPTKVAAEYAHGYFALSESFNPLNQRYQYTFLEKNAAAVGDTYELLLLPEKHTVVDMYFEASPNQEMHPSLYRNAPNMAGLVVDFFIDLYDKNCVKTGTVAAATIAAVNLGNTVSGRKAVTPAQFGEYLPAGTFGRAGFKIVSLPTTAGVTLKDISGYIRLGVHVLANDLVNNK